MKTIYVMRHAHSDMAPGTADQDRTLNEEGLRACSTMGRYMGNASLEPDLVLCSSAARAVATLEGIAHGLPDGTDVQVEEDLYLAEAGKLALRLRALDESVGSVMLIGHNPGLQDLVVGISKDGADLERAQSGYPSATLATLAYDGAWADLAHDSCTLTSVIEPGDLSED